MSTKLKIALMAFLVVLMAFGSVGCKKDTKDSSHEKVVYQPDPATEAQLAALRAENERLRRQIDEVDQLMAQRNAEVSEWKMKYQNAQRELLAMQNATPTVDPNKARMEAELADLQDRITEYEGIIAKRDSDGNLVLVLDNKVFFRSGSSKLNSKSTNALMEVANLLNTEFAGKNVSVDGHCDSDPIRSSGKVYRTNWELSSSRSLSVLHYLKDSGVPENQLSTRAFSYFAPVAPNDSPANKAKNRRVEIVILKKSS